LHRHGGREFFWRQDAESLVSWLRKRQLSHNLLPATDNCLHTTKRLSCFCLSKRPVPFAICNRWRVHLVAQKIPFPRAGVNVTFYRIFILVTSINHNHIEIRSKNSEHFTFSTAELHQGIGGYG